jgi:hypothetical protein
MAVVLFFFAHCFLLGCPRSIPTEFREVLFKPAEDKRLAFERLPIEKQVDLCIFAQHLEPPDLSLIELLASNGKKAIPILLGKLNSKGISDRDRQIIINIFRKIHTSSFALNDNSEVISSIRLAIDKINDPLWKRLSQEDYSQMLITSQKEN